MSIITYLNALILKSIFEEQRTMFLPRGLPRQPNMVIFNEVMNNKEKIVLFKLSKFCKEILLHLM